MQMRSGAFLQRSSSRKSAHQKLPLREGDRIVTRVLGRIQVNRITSNTETARDPFHCKNLGLSLSRIEPWPLVGSLPRFGATALSSHHRNDDASQVDREPRTQLGAAKHQDNPIAVSQPCEAYPSHDGTTNSDRSIIAS